MSGNVTLTDVLVFEAGKLGALRELLTSVLRRQLRCHQSDGLAELRWVEKRIKAMMAESEP